LGKTQIPHRIEMRPEMSLEREASVTLQASQFRKVELCGISKSNVD